jgi:subtilisin family serine protease
LSEIDNFEDLNIENLLDSPPSISNKKIIVRSNKKQEATNSFFRNYWWLFLFIPLFILLLLNCCNSVGESSIGSIPSNLLKRPPIDTSKLIKGDSGISLIVSDIFNIALKDKSKDLSVFSTELKKQFPDSGYQIVYYDTSTLRIQFKFPDSNRTVLKSKIKEKMDNYELLIWDESIFRASKTFNDPALLDVEKSWYLSAIGVYDAWEKTTGKKDVVIAVIDDGFDLNNKDFANKIVKPYNVKTKNSVVNADNDRIHGTHVAGLALGNANNGFGISGIAPECSFMPVQIAQSGDVFSSSDVIDAILYAVKNDADVINISLGKYFNDAVTTLPKEVQKEYANNLGKDEEEFWNELLTYADKENSIIVFATGNQNILVGLDPMLRSDKAIKVAAVNRNLARTSFSNFGDKVTIFAPGEKINSIIPGNQEKIMDGTSMASPIVAGAIGLMKSMNKNISLDKVKELLKSTGDPVSGEPSGSKFLKVNKLLNAQ